MIVKCEGCGNATESFFTVMGKDGQYCPACGDQFPQEDESIDAPSHGRMFTDDLKALVKFHVEHNEMESNNFQMAASLGELVSVIDSKKFIKLKREINAIVKKEISKRITDGIKEKLDEYSHTRPYEEEK